MIKKIPSLIFTLFIVMILSIVLPDIYWKMFETSTPATDVSFSPILKDFVFWKVVNKQIIRMDNTGSEITREEYENLMPFQYFRQLASDGRMPDSIDGVLIDLHEVRKNNFMLKVRSRNIGAPQIQLYPLFESQSGKVNLEMPTQFFRINDRIEFINCEQNEINENVSKKFTNAMVQEGFAFPAKLIGGNPTTRKPFDEGYFIVDNTGSLFHLKQIKGNPFCKKINLPSPMEIVHILISETSLKESYGIIIANDNSVYLLTYDDYKFIKLPLTGYDYTNTTFELRGDLFYRKISLADDHGEKTIVTDRNYKVIAEHEEYNTTKYETFVGKIFESVFPFELSLTNGNTSYVNFYFSWFVKSALWANAAFFLILLVIFWMKKVNISAHPFELLLVLLTGIYGLISVLITKEKD